MSWIIGGIVEYTEEDYAGGNTEVDYLGGVIEYNEAEDYPEVEVSYVKDYLGGSTIVKNDNDPYIPTTSNQKDDVISKLIPDKIPEECSIVAPNPNICLSTESVGALADKLHTQGTPLDIISAAKKKTGCATQLCVIQSGLLPKQLQNKEIANFKVAGPTNVDWLSNIHIDNTLDMWTKKFPEF